MAKKSKNKKSMKSMKSMKSKQRKKTKNKIKRKLKQKNIKVDLRSKRIYNNISKLECMIIDYTFKDPNKRRELILRSKKIMNKLDRIRAGAHTDKSLVMAQELYNNIIIQDGGVIDDYLKVLDSNDHSNESSDKLLEKAIDRNLIKENKNNAEALKKFHGEKKTNEKLYINRLRSILITDDIIAGGIEDTPEDSKKGEEKIKKIYKNAIDAGEAGYFSKAAQKLLVWKDAIKTAEERAFNLSSFFMKSLNNTSDQNKPVDLEAISKEKEKQIRSGTPTGEKPASEKDTKKLAAMATVSTQIEDKQPCPPKGRDPESKVAWVKKNYPLCVDNGAFYDNVLQIIGLALTPLLMIATSGVGGDDDGHSGCTGDAETDCDGDGKNNDDDDDDDGDGINDDDDSDDDNDVISDVSERDPTAEGCPAPEPEPESGA